MGQDTSINTFSAKLTAIETENATQTANITSLTNRMNSTDSKNTTQDTNITSLTTRITNIESKNIEQDTILSSFNNSVYYSSYGTPICNFRFKTNENVLISCPISGIDGTAVKFSYERRGFSENITISPFTINYTSTWKLYTGNLNTIDANTMSYIEMIIQNVQTYESKSLDTYPNSKTEWISDDAHFHSFSVLTTTSSGHAHYAQGNTAGSSVTALLSYPLKVSVLAKKSNYISFKIEPMKYYTNAPFMPTCSYITGFNISWGTN